MSIGKQIAAVGILAVAGLVTRFDPGVAAGAGALPAHGRAGVKLPRIRLAEGVYSPEDLWCWFGAFLPGPRTRIVYAGIAGPAIWPIHSNLPIAHRLAYPRSWRRRDIGIPAACSTADGKILAGVVWHGSSPRIGIWNLKSKLPVRRLNVGSIGQVISMAFSPNGRKLVVGASLYPSKCRAFVIATHSWRVENRLSLPAALSRKIIHRISGLTFGPGGSVLAVTGRWFCRWQLPSGRLVLATAVERKDRGRWRSPLILLHHGRWAVTTDTTTARLRWIDTATGKVIRRDKIHFPGKPKYWKRHGIWGIAQLDSGKYIACAAMRDLDDLMRGRVLIVNSRTGDVVAAPRVAMGCFWGIAATRKGRALATFGFLGVRDWNLPRRFWKAAARKK